MALNNDVSTNLKLENVEANENFDINQQNESKILRAKIQKLEDAKSQLTTELDGLKNTLKLLGISENSPILHMKISECPDLPNVKRIVGTCFIFNVRKQTYR